MRAALDVLLQLFASEGGGVDEEGAQNARSFLTMSGAVEPLLLSLQDEELWVRFTCIQVLTSLAYADRQRLELGILQSSAGMMHLVAVLQVRGG